MRFLTLVVAVLATACLAVSPAAAGPTGDAMAGPFPGCSIEAAPHGPWAIDFGAAASAPRPPSLRSAARDGQAAQPKRVIPVEYSEGYKTRVKIHKILSYATLPLFVTDYALGQTLYNDPGNESLKGTHGGFAAATGILFGANSALGVWNLWEGRKDPNHRKLRTAHGILMLASDVGFLATGLLAPDSEGGEHGTYHPTDYSNQKSTHRAVAITSMGIATVGYLIMLFGAH